MPLFPTTIIPAPTRSATPRTASAGDPVSAWVVTSTPATRARAATSSSTDSTALLGVMLPWNAVGRLAGSATGRNALTTCSGCPKVRARSIAVATATAAVSEPSVPTTIGPFILLFPPAALALCLAAAGRSHHGGPAASLPVAAPEVCAIAQSGRARYRVEVMGFEPTASSMRPKRSSQLSYTPEGPRRLADGVCTSSELRPIWATGQLPERRRRRAG